MMEDMRRVSDDRARQDREALERQARERAQSHLASMSLQSSGSAPAPPPNWPAAPNTYPPSYQVSVLLQHSLLRHLQPPDLKFDVDSM